MKTTFSIIKADVGGWPGHAKVHPDLEDIARKKLTEAKKDKICLVSIRITKKDVN